METKKERLTKEVAKAVNVGKAWECETVDFADPIRPLTCLEVDFPILPINRNAAVESASGAAVKPVYKASKWWARRSPSVFRAILLSSSIKAPDDSAETAKAVWAAYYGNHQRQGAFKHLKVADIFMGGGTTIVEGARLGMQMWGNDLNPIAWLVSKNAMAKLERAEVEDLLAEIEAEVKPQTMPFYTCDCPRDHKGRWTRISTSEVMADDFKPESVPTENRKDYKYEGPEIIYVFWAKHGPCQITGCGHRTPIMTSPVMAVKSISVKYWEHKCRHCGGEYDLEERKARMAPGAPLVVAETERPFAILERFGAKCVLCGQREKIIPAIAQFKPKKKKVELALLVHPDWLRGEAGKDDQGNKYGGSVDSTIDATIKWNHARAAKCRLVEVRGKLPDQVICPETGIIFKTGKDGGNVPKKSNYACGSCGTVQDILKTVKASGTTGPVAMYAIQGYCPECDKRGELYSGRFFIPAHGKSTFDAALHEWEERKETDLKDYWPRSELPYGFMTHMNNGGIPNHGYTHWKTMFNDRQLLVHCLLLKHIATNLQLSTRRSSALAVLGAFQQYLRFNCMFTVYHRANDQTTKLFANNNYAPKSTMMETPVFSDVGDGTWRSAAESVLAAVDWSNNPWETFAKTNIEEILGDLAAQVKGKSLRVMPLDALTSSATLSNCSSTDLGKIAENSIDIVVTDPPFGGLLHYSELSDFFYVWLRLVLKDKYPEYFEAEYTPKSLEAVANRSRHPNDPDDFYQRLLTDCWKEVHRILKPGGLLAFTFHHSEDAPWVSVLESLFDSGFILKATYPVRSDKAFADQAKPGAFGSQKIEYDIIHVCRKRMENPQPISWAKMRRQVLQDVRRLQEMLEHHQEEGLPEADLQVIRRGKALEYFSRHYGKVYKDEGVSINVLEALVGINQLLDEETGGVKEPPPHNAEPFTRMLLRLFDGKSELARDQMQKFLRGTGSAPSDYVNRGWCFEKKKIFYLTPLLEIARVWIGKHRRGMTSDYDQAAFLIGACFEGSGINANETLNNPNFKLHPALSALLTWHGTHGATNKIRNAASIASSLYRTWESKHQTPKHKQLSLFFSEEDV